MDNFDLDKMEDKELVAEYLAGQEEILPYLINKHIKSVYRFVYGLIIDKNTTEDITQEVFVKVWKKIKGYKEKYSFKTWLFSIARNTVIDYWRKKKDVAFSEFDSVDGGNILEDTLADDQPSAEEVFSKVEDQNVFNETLNKLSPLYREVLLLKYADDLSIEEIAKVLNRPVETVKSQHYRGVMHLKKLLLRIKL